MLEKHYIKNNSKFSKNFAYVTLTTLANPLEILEEMKKTGYKPIMIEKDAMIKRIYFEKKK